MVDEWYFSLNGTPFSSPHNFTPLFSKLKNTKKVVHYLSDLQKWTGKKYETTQSKIRPYFHPLRRVATKRTKQSGKKEAKPVRKASLRSGPLRSF